ncbi:helix-turn-helix transcriptional regulator [Blastococcus sp. MG754426]|uniref:TetR/AcrR family transcriptional regulator n=1 Tax=unclassified Blastococcus TaxID=2619396 RepID=UPI001EF0B907|nr:MULTISPECIES: helix-turn-helix domain-containing protein [unclassified Blastococcus]MCF6509166.1 helix-turn-helix transcriptional regulator [Blastococcus sp. MG754426]MCF6512882.1 helix-turn-helix transcriptional regulator [Blastococcus sp. MG754427]MCF6733586.1 helix-turn-helix transcriptional regulator [Blastococcus sp. KM273129]
MNRTRAELLAGAAEAFAAQGLRRATMQSVAAATGVAKATLYNYFRTKDEVARALLAAELQRLADLAGGLPPAAGLAVLADELATHPVLRRLAATEPDRLVELLAPGEPAWAALTGRLAAVLGTDDDGAQLAGRWLVGVVLQPGLTTQRRRQAALLGQLLGPTG